MNFSFSCSDLDEVGIVRELKNWWGGSFTGSGCPGGRWSRAVNQSRSDVKGIVYI